MSATTARSPVPPKKWNEDGYYASGAFGSNASPRKRGPRGKGKRPYANKKAHKAKHGKPPNSRRENNDRPERNVLFHRLSSPLSPSGPLLGRIGGSARDEPTLANSDRIDGESESDAMRDGADTLPLSTTSRFYTPGEVDQFLESVISASPGAAPCSACTANNPSLAPETHHPPVVQRLVKMEDVSSSVLYPPTQDAVSSAPPSNLVPSRHSPSLLDDAVLPPSASAVEECRKLLAPVLIVSAQARDYGRRLGLEQCLGLLSDDHCANFIQKAKEMRHQLSLLPQQTSVNQGWGGESLKRHGVDEADAWVRNTRSRFSPVNTVVADVSRRDSDITLVEGTSGKSPPGAPRAAVLRSDFAESAHHGASYHALVASPTTEAPASAPSLVDLVYQAIQMYPTLMPTPDQPATEVDTTHVSVGRPTADQPGNSAHPLSPIQPADPPIVTDFVSHLPTEPGVWFRRRGRRFAEIVDVDIQVSDDMFYLSGERQPSRLRMHLGLCSVPVGALTKDEGNDDAVPAAPALRDAVDGVIARRAVQWPKKGKLVVQVNPESERNKTWLPYVLESEPLDVTACVQPGKNVFRFIQLSDLSEFDFVLVASPPPPEEEWRSWDWASFVDVRRKRTRTTTTSTDDPMDGAGGLTEFAHVPIVVRS